MDAPRRGQVGREALARLPTHPGLCADCVHLELQASARSVFVRCGLSDADPRFPRYPRLPVRACAGHRRGTGDEVSSGEGATE
jgi:hypothetical protein